MNFKILLTPLLALFLSVHTTFDSIDLQQRELIDKYEKTLGGTQSYKVLSIKTPIILVPHIYRDLLKSKNLIVCSHISSSTTSNLPNSSVQIRKELFDLQKVWMKFNDRVPVEDIPKWQNNLQHLAHWYAKNKSYLTLAPLAHEESQKFDKIARHAKEYEKSIEGERVIVPQFLCLGFLCWGDVV